MYQSAAVVDFLVSIHVPLAEHDDTSVTRLLFPKVSIHVPLAEHDCSFRRWRRERWVSIHVPLAEHDANNYTPNHVPKDVSIHVPLAEHDDTSVTRLLFPKVSIHVPLAEHDDCSIRLDVPFFGFQFTCPSRSTTEADTGR